MKRTLIGLALLTSAGIAAAAPALPTFGLLDGRGALATVLSGSATSPTMFGAAGLGPAAPKFLAGNTVDGFATARNGFIDGVFVLTADTPRLDGLARANAQLFLTGYSMLLPAYEAIDPVLMRIAAPGEPVTAPIGAQIVDGAKLLSDFLNGPQLRLSTLAGLGAMSF